MMRRIFTDVRAVQLTGEAVPLLGPSITAIDLAIRVHTYWSPGKGTGVTKLPPNTFDRTAGSPSLAAAGQGGNREACAHHACRSTNGQPAGDCEHV
jgi:hypothetical protein